MLNVNNYDNSKKSDLLVKIMKYGLAAQDSALFLDTHPNDPIMLIQHHEYCTKLKQLKDEYTAMYGPLNCFTPDLAGGWRYVDGPWPWAYEFQ